MRRGNSTSGCASTCAALSRRAVASGWAAGRASTKGSSATGNEASLAGTNPGECSSTPASISPRSKAASCTSPVASMRSRATPGEWARKPRTQSGSSSKPTGDTKASRRRPTSPAAAACATAGNRCARASSSRASGSKASPAGLRATWRRLRSNRRTPSVASSCAMAWVRGGWVMCSRRAARPKCSSSASTTNWRHTRRSMVTSLICQAYQ